MIFLSFSGPASVKFCEQISCSPKKDCFFLFALLGIIFLSVSLESQRVPATSGSYEALLYFRKLEGVILCLQEMDGIFMIA